MNSEQMLQAALIMKEAAEINRGAADQIEESVRQMKIIFDADYGGVAPQLLEKLNDVTEQLSKSGPAPEKEKG